jgi:NAD(P)-dependent dehydrogenase (short-subunit alcohol dehydrogenase family)
MQRSSDSGNILITGGTSGLGLELVRIFLNKGYYVVATGRQPIVMPGFEDKFRLFKVDFSNLKQCATTFRQICDLFRFDLIINNAGILSPPEFTLTSDGYEYTFQVNFLAHLLLNEMIVSKQRDASPLKIAAVTSPAYRLAGAEMSSSQSKSGYKPLKAYSESKLFLALMCRHLALKYHDEKISFISFDPGTFSSGIYRMQGSIFRSLYRIAAPFMRKPSTVATSLSEILDENNLLNGALYNLKKRTTYLSEPDSSVIETFWADCDEKIGIYLSEI